MRSSPANGPVVQYVRAEGAGESGAVWESVTGERFVGAIVGGGEAAVDSARTHERRRRSSDVLPLWLGAFGRFLAVGAGTAGLATIVTTIQIPAFDRTPAIATLLAYLGLILLFARAHADEARAIRVPRAHVVTLARGGLLLAVAQLAAVREASSSALLACAALALLALILDGVDGHLARKDGTASRFGAWFDQELDAALVLVLSVVVWRADIAGAWVLLAGAWRYAFLGLRALFPRFRGELPPSQVRRVVCVVTISTLLAVLTPLLGAGAKVHILLAAVGVLSWSFTTDLVRLWSSTRPLRAHPIPAQR